MNIRHINIIGTKSCKIHFMSESLFHDFKQIHPNKIKQHENNY